MSDKSIKSYGYPEQILNGADLPYRPPGSSHESAPSAPEVDDDPPPPYPGIVPPPPAAPVHTSFNPPNVIIAQPTIRIPTRPNIFSDTWTDEDNDRLLKQCCFWCCIGSAAVCLIRCF